MKLFAFGDSWTEGQGADLSKENSIESVEDRKIFRNERSWPKHLSELLNVNCVYKSKSGQSNNDIFKSVVDSIKSKEISNDDLVIVMWSSTLRDQVPFFPDGEWHSWGKKYMDNDFKKEWFIDKNLSKISDYNQFLINFKRLYIEQLYSDSYYNIINQNYIIFLQELLKHYGISYFFCDAFDMMINNLDEKDDKTKLIDQIRYWGFGEKTFKDHLIGLGEIGLFETDVPFGITPGKHPSELGYKLIAKEMNDFIISNNIIVPNQISKNKLI